MNPSKSLLETVKKLGIIIMAAAAVSFVALLIISLQVAWPAHSSCPGLETGCTVLGHIPVLSFIGLGALAALMVGGVWLAIKSYKDIAFTIVQNSHLAESAKRLTGDYKKIYEIVVESEGTAFQNDIISKSGFSKVKVSRVLDRLEVAGLVERRRRGMANLIVLKR